MSRPDLDALYDPPAERIQKAVLDRLIDFHRAYLRVATFFCLATGSEHGLDASPRGGPPGFVHALEFLEELLHLVVIGLQHCNGVGRFVRGGTAGFGHDDSFVL